MTKKDLERRNRYLLLQLKVIAGLLKDTAGLKQDEPHERIGAVHHLTDPETIKRHLGFIEAHDTEYNFYNKTMGIKEYEE